MPTQQEIADHLGLNQSEVSRHMSGLGIDWRNEQMQKIRLRYLDHLRAMAAGHRSEDGLDLVQERAQTEQVERELKLLTLAEKKGLLVNLAQLEPELQRMFSAFRTQLLGRDDKLKAELDALHGIDVDLQLLNDHTRAALDQLARYEPGGGKPDPQVGAAGGAAGVDDDDALGAHASPAQREGDGAAGGVQP